MKGMTMKIIKFVAVVATVGAISACNKQAPSGDQVPAAAQQSTGKEQGEVYSGTGTVKSITGDQVAIAHGPIKGAGWPAMTMTFTAPPDIANGAKVGSQVDFSFRQNGSAYVLTSLKPR